VNYLWQVFFTLNVSWFRIKLHSARIFLCLHLIVCHSCSIRDLHCKPEKHISALRDMVCYVVVNGNDMYTCKIKCLHFWSTAWRTTCRKATAPWLCFCL